MYITGLEGVPFVDTRYSDSQAAPGSRLGEQELFSSEETFRRLFEFSSDGILIADSETRRFHLSNRKMGELLGYSPEELSRLSVADIHDEGDLPLVLKLFETLRRGELTRAGNVPLKRKDGSVFYADISAFSITLGGREYLVGTFRDETKHKQNEEALRGLSRDLEKRVQKEVEKRRLQEQLLIQQSRLAAMGEMVGAIAHQWRQPLNVVGLIVQSLKDLYDDGQLTGESLDKAVEKVMAQLVFMSKTIDDFRSFFRPAKTEEAFSPAEAVGEVLSLVSPQISNNFIKVQLTDEAPPQTSITGYPNEFKQVLLNIINNARDAVIEAREKGGLAVSEGKISISIMELDGKLFVRVSDNAGGIPPEIMHRIFEPYFTTKEDSKGTGIGLYMSKTIIERNMGGRLTAANGPEGAEFTIAFELGKTTGGRREDLTGA